MVEEGHNCKDLMCFPTILLSLFLYVYVIMLVQEESGRIHTYCKKFSTASNEWLSEDIENRNGCLFQEHSFPTPR